MKTDVLNDVCDSIENVLELNGIKSVEFENNVIKVKVDNGRAFVRMFPKKEQRVHNINEISFCKYVKAHVGCFEFILCCTDGEYKEFNDIYGVTEVEGEDE